jgi:hypothetical protein
MVFRSNKKTKFITCVSCSRFCENYSIENIKKLVKSCKNEGFDNIVFRCEKGLNSLKKLIDKNKDETRSIIDIVIKDKNGSIWLRK